MKKTGCFEKAAALAAAMLIYGASTVSAADLTIQQAVDMALEQNTSLKITEKGEDTAKAKLKSARGSNSFNVSASGSLTDSKADDSQAIENGATSLNVSVPLYSGGKNQANIKSAEIGVDAAKLTTQRAREDLRLQVIKAYYNVLESKKTVQIDQESVDRYKAHLTNMEQLYSAGSKARLDVLRSSVELTNARQTLIKAKNDYEVNVVTLKNLLRMDQSEALNLTEDFTYTPFFAKMDACVAYAFDNRKDYLVDHYHVKQSELAVTMAQSGYLPTLSLNAGVSYDQRFHPNHNSDHSRSVGLKASWNIFDSGVTEAAVDKAKTDLEVAELTLKRDKEDIDLNVRQQYYNMREAQRRLVATQSAVKEAEEDYYITNEKYRAGQGIMLDILDAQVALSTAQLNYISAEYDYARYKAAVENAVGLDIDESSDIIDPAATAAAKERWGSHPIPPDAPVSRDYRRARSVVDDEAEAEEKEAVEAAKEAAENRREHEVR